MIDATAPSCLDGDLTGELEFPLDENARLVLAFYAALPRQPIRLLTQPR